MKTASLIEKYLATRGIRDPWEIEGCADRNFSGAVVIPALAEGENLFATLASLSANPPELLDRFLVLVVVNHRADAPPADKADNLATLRRLSETATSSFPLRLAWVDAASAGLELPAKTGGVGMARKLGFDLALGRLDHKTDPLLIALDADTLVRPDYLASIAAHFRATEAGGAIIHFRHQEGRSPLQHRSIERYELFLRAYVLGLSLAGSPYAFHTVGSAMACRASAYVRMGGMNSRRAGEDFYFLQQLHRTAGISQVTGTAVYPSARASHRVPFGTGRSIGRLMAGEPDAVLFYRADCFRILGDWLSLISNSLDDEGAALLIRASAISTHLGEYLEDIGTAGVWDKFRHNHPRPQSLISAFHEWFDGLKTMKLIHHLSADAFPRCEPEAALPDLLIRAGIPPAREQSEQLALLRKLQLGDQDQPFHSQALT